MRGVVVDGAYDYAARPGSDLGQRRALEFSSLIARFHVLHLAVLSVRDPRGKDLQLDEVMDRRNATELESSVARALLDAGWKVGEQGAMARGEFGRAGCTHILQEATTWGCAWKRLLLPAINPTGW